MKVKVMRPEACTFQQQCEILWGWEAVGKFEVGRTCNACFQCLKDFPMERMTLDISYWVMVTHASHVHCLAAQGLLSTGKLPSNIPH